MDVVNVGSSPTESSRGEVMVKTLDDFIKEDQAKRKQEVPSANSAIVRKKPSRPMRFLYEKGLLVGDMLDYGCGRGADAKFFGMDAYDPFWMPNKPVGQYDTITCHFVMNVVDEKTQRDILADIRNLLRFGGNAYITVRRDIKENYHVRGYQQSLVYLDLESIEKNTSYEIYRLIK